MSIYEQIMKCLTLNNLFIIKELIRQSRIRAFSGFHALVQNQHHGMEVLYYVNTFSIILNMAANYDDIINIDYESIKSKRYPQMTMLNRAAQFAPFAALTGHEEAIEETGAAHKADEVLREVFYD